MSDRGLGPYERQRVTLSLSCNKVLSPVLRRVAAMLAAQAQLPSDRVSDVVMVASAFADTACESIADEQITVEIDVSARNVGISVGPLTQDVGHMLHSNIGGGDPLVLAAASSLEVEDDGREASLLRIAFAA